MPDASIVYPLAGGAMIGLSATWLMLSVGRVAGVTGILSGLLTPKTEDINWRLGFVLGLLVAGTFAFGSQSASQLVSHPKPWSLLVLAGILVGFGARLGGGCTSGHGVCGNSRLSPRSIVATCTFMVAGAVTVFALRHLVGGPS